MPPRTELHPTQTQHLRDSLVALERHLAAVERLAAGSGEGGLFPEHVADLTADEREQQRAAVARARQAMRAAMAEHGLTAEAPAVGARQAIQAQWALAEIGLEELSPRAMRGYGTLDAGQTRALEELVAQLQSALPQAAAKSPASAAGALADALMAATAAALEAIAQALAAAVARGAPNDELPLIAGDALAQHAQVIVRAAVPAAAALPAFDIDSIPWRLDTPKLAGLGREYLLGRFRKQLAPLEPQIRAAMGSYGFKIR